MKAIKNLREKLLGTLLLWYITGSEVLAQQGGTGQQNVGQGGSTEQKMQDILAWVLANLHWLFLLVIAVLIGAIITSAVGDQRQMKSRIVALFIVCLVYFGWSWIRDDLANMLNMIPLNPYL